MLKGGGLASHTYGKSTNDMTIHGTTMFWDNPIFLLFVWTLK